MLFRSRIGICSLWYGATELLPEMVRLCRHGQPDEVVIVDNASPDGGPFQAAAEELRGLGIEAQVLRTDNGPEFLGNAFITWAKAAGMAIQYIQPGKPNQNAYIGRFNRTLREELLDANLFMRLDDVREAVYWWQIEYNEQRPHNALGGIPPAAYRIKNAENSTYDLSA